MRMARHGSFLRPSRQRLFDTSKFNPGADALSEASRHQGSSHESIAIFDKEEMIIRAVGGMDGSSVSLQ